MNSNEYQLTFPGEMTRRCPDCGLDKAATEFRRNSSRPDGLSFYCKPCCKQRDAAGYRKRRSATGRTVRERIAVPDGMKCCARCRDIKPVDAFALAPRQPGGRNCYCKNCNNTRARETHTLRKYGLSQQEVADAIG